MSEDINQNNVKKMESEYSDSILSNVAKTVGYYSNIGWKTVKITLNIEPKPSQRPRLSGYRIYVPGAAKHTAFFNREVFPTLGNLWIDKPCKVIMDVYVKTPDSFSKSQKLLAELKILRPWTHTGDIDNFTKSYLDMIQGNKKRGHKGIMSDDCLVIESISNKYYSVSPRVELVIKYMGSVPKVIKNVLKIHDIPRPN